MDQYYGRDNRNRSAHQGNKAAGCFLVFLMVIIAGFMVYSIYLSWKNPTNPPPYAAPTEIAVASPESSYVISPDTGTPAGEPSSTPSDSASLTPSPGPTGSPEESPTVSPSPETSPAETPKPSPSDLSSPGASPGKSPKPTPAASPPPKNEKWFSGAKPDGPPTGYDTERGDMFEGVEGKAYIVILAEPKDFKDVRAYLINKQKKTYRSIDFKPDEDDPKKFKTVIAPGTYKLKLVKAGYFTFTSDEMGLEDGLEAEIREPLDRRPTFRVITNPPGAKVYFDDHMAGNTPVTVDNLEAKKYVIKIVKPGYQTQVLNITFKKAQEVIKNLTLIKE